MKTEVNMLGMLPKSGAATLFKVLYSFFFDNHKYVLNKFWQILILGRLVNSLYCQIFLLHIILLPAYNVPLSAASPHSFDFLLNCVISWQLTLSKETERSRLMPEGARRGILLGERPVEGPFLTRVKGLAAFGFFLAVIFVNKGLFVDSEWRNNVEMYMNV